MDTHKEILMDKIRTVPRRMELGRARRGGVVCPSLVLSVKVVCDRFGPLHEPGRSHVLEYCTTEEHLRCPRWSLAPGPHAPASQSRDAQLAMAAAARQRPSAH